MALQLEESDKILARSERASVVKGLNSWVVERALVVLWNISSGQFGFKIVTKDRPATRKGILSIVSSVYDALGFVAPFSFQAKQPNAFYMSYVD